MARRPQDKKDQWLLIKAKDAYARTAADPQIVDEEITSLLSGYSNADLEKGGKLRSDHSARQKKKLAIAGAAPRLRTPAGARKGILPTFVEPSLAQLTDAPPAGKNWVHEIKFDGYRIQARLDGGKVQLLTRSGLDWTRRFPTVAAALKGVAVSSALLDGELVVQDERGISTFGGLQADLTSGRRDRIAYFAFDLMYCEGADYRGVALAERRSALKAVLELLPEDSIVKFSDHLDRPGHEVLAQACRMGLEGIVSKRTDQSYISGRGLHWLKSKCFLEQEFVIVGYVPSTAHRAAIGSLVLGHYDDGRLVHDGRAGTGFSAEIAVTMRRLLDAIRAPQPPAFRDKPSREASKGVIWVKPKLVAEIQYRGWGSEGLLRQASFKGLREDKPAEEIVLEKQPTARARSIIVRAGGVRLTHPERILWPDPGVTKQGLADFYCDIERWILPHVTGRVLSAVRCPSGADKQCFYARHAWAGLTDHVRLVDVGESEPMFAIEDLKGLLALVQASVLEIHPWGSRIDRLEEPDRIIFDLDPGEGVPWGRVIEAAKEVRDRLKTHKIKSFVKVSGGKGLHVVAPIARGPDWDRVKEFSRRIAEAMTADKPALYLDRMTKKLRRGKVFVDYLRNGRGSTAVAAYSTRARKGAPVCVPLDWEELSEAIGPSHFTIDNLRQRLDFLQTDPWAGFQKLRQGLPDQR
jgi:bifunctional non-homologous end joining protein LigD